ncbi:ParB N-terminal domain-containing protein [Bosea sp. TND4EK4]|uniref:ParB/RepB/Spo0J family partition protein n=1 Tax=Bosea sp. TND4EK4 TaxID=1907408 RepID=UPI000954F198|nr:ParB N-terminal domain-containing protein [Bosea sp. TND4EK4]SIP95229.1 chromosome partitioning protein, ParB family [Bosea sp. TND4EK4]
MRDVLDLTSSLALPEHEIEIEIAAIDVVDRLRLVDRAYVEMIAASVSETYLHQPIAVATTLGGGNRYVLVDGENRLEAFKLLGRTTIPARIRELTREEREKHEIHANLIRNELTALDRAVFVGRLADIFAAEAGAQNGGDRKSKKWREKNQFSNLGNWSEFSKEASRRTGLGKTSIYRCRELAGKLAPDTVAAIRGTKVADNQAQLQALAELEPEQQLAVARAIKAGASTVAKAREAAGLVPSGGAVREADRMLTRIEPMLPRMSLADLQTLATMVANRIAALTPPAKTARAKKGDAA